MNILIVDDEELVRWFLERALKNWGHNVISVSNIRDAMSQLKKKAFDILFTDLRMPEGDGSTLVKHVGENAANKMKIVVCSAFITSDMSRNLREKGIQTLKKPFKLAELENTIKLCLD